MRFIARPSLSLLTFAAVAVAVMTFASRAHAAPTVAINTTGVIRIAADHKTQVPSLIVHSNQQGINFKECTDDTYFRIPLTTTGIPTSDSLQVWAGTSDCTQQGATTTSTATCWPIYAGVTPSLAFYLDISVQDIVSQLYTSTKTLTYSRAAVDVCSSAAASSGTTTTTDDAGNTVVSSGETTVNVFFMWFSGGASTPEASAPAYPIKVKLVGPNAPTNVTASSGDGEIIVNWNAPSGEADLQGFNVYASVSGGGTTSDASGDVTTVCNDAAQGTQLFDDAGNPVVDDAGNAVYVDDAGNPVTQDAGCYSVYTPPPGGGSCSAGTIDTSDQAVDAGTTTLKQATGTTNASATVGGLNNGTSYAVAVAAFDSFQNDGTLSNVVCATPEPIDDFWKKYREEGGTAGGCACNAVGGAGSIPFGGVVMIVASALLARHRRSRGSRGSRDHDRDGSAAKTEKDGKH